MLLLIAAAQLAAAGWAASFPADVALAPDSITQVQVNDPWTRVTRLRAERPALPPGQYHRRDLPRFAAAGGATIRKGHVANAIMVHGTDGRIYSYVIDSTYGDWMPGRLFPLNEAAVAFHDRNHDGLTDFAQLPAIASRWPEGYRAAP